MSPSMPADLILKAKAAAATANAKNRAIDKEVSQGSQGN